MKTVFVLQRLIQTKPGEYLAAVGKQADVTHMVSIHKSRVGAERRRDELLKADQLDREHTKKYDAWSTKWNEEFGSNPRNSLERHLMIKEGRKAALRVWGEENDPDNERKIVRDNIVYEIVEQNVND